MPKNYDARAVPYECFVVGFNALFGLLWLGPVRFGLVRVGWVWRTLIRIALIRFGSTWFGFVPIRCGRFRSIPFCQVR
jgi:hypothetical protein